MYRGLYWNRLEKYYLETNEEQMKECLKQKYEKVMDTVLDFAHPRTFTEKIQWMKFFDCTSQKTRLADKYAVRKWIDETIGAEYLVPLLGVWESFTDIDFDLLPQSFCLKTNHGSGMNCVVKDKSKVNMKEEGRVFQWWMDCPFWIGTIETQYKNIQHKIIAEKYIEEMDGELYDYKFHCFNGKPMFVQCIGGRDLKKHTGYQMNFDLDWKPLDWIFEDYPAFPYDVQKPECLTEMIRIAEKLSSEFSYVRVDLYEISGKVFFGEMTFTPASGMYPYKGTWTREKDLELGDKLQLS